MKSVRWMLFSILVFLLSCNPIIHKPKERITVVWESNRDIPITTTTSKENTTTVTDVCKPKLPLLLAVPPPPRLSNECEHNDACVQEALFNYIESLTGTIKTYQNEYQKAIVECE